jgi:hypothetical protein
MSTGLTYTGSATVDLLAALVKKCLQLLMAIALRLNTAVRFTLCQDCIVHCLVHQTLCCTSTCSVKGSYYQHSLRTG